jgi:hypothetical protein
MDLHPVPYLPLYSQPSPSTASRIQFAPTWLTITSRSTSESHHPRSPRNSLHKDLTSSVASPKQSSSASWFPTFRFLLSRLSIHHQSCPRFTPRSIPPSQRLRPCKVHALRWPSVPLALFLTRASAEPTKSRYHPARVQPPRSRALALLPGHSRTGRRLGARNCQG